MSMSQIEVVQSFKCPLCLNLSTDADKANACFAKCSAKAKRQAAYERRLATWNDRMNELRLNLDSIENLGPELEKQLKKHFGAVAKLEIELRFGDVSNSHSAPIGKKTNWCGRDNGPTSYPGFQGRIRGKWLKNGRNMENKVVDSITDALDDSWARGIAGVNTGTGGGSNKDFEYELKIFLADFPKLQAAYDKFQELEIANSAMDKQLELQAQRFSSKVEGLLKSNTDYQNSEKRISEIHAEIEKLQKEKAKEYDKLYKIRDNTVKAASATLDKDFPIDPKYSFDKEGYEKLKSVFGRRSWY